MEVTGLDLISRAMRSIGKLGEAEEPSAEAAEDARVVLNEVLDTWQMSRILVPAELQTQHACSAGSATYTIGAGATWDQARPVRVIRAQVIPDTSKAPANQLRLQMQIHTPGTWARKVLPLTSSTFPTELYYDRAVDATTGYGTVHLYPVPLSSLPAVVLWTNALLSQFSDLSTAYDFANGYVRAMRLALAEALAPEYGLEPPPTLRRQAEAAVGDLYAMNHNRDEQVVDPALGVVGGDYDAETADY